MHIRPGCDPAIEANYLTSQQKISDIMIPRLITSGLFCLAASATMNADFAPYDLRCEQLIDPIGIESATPRLGWKCHSDSRDFTQSACRLLVASDPSGLEEGKSDLWDSGWITSDQSVNIVYDGKPLEAGREYFWTVAIRDKDGISSGFSTPARFTTGLHSSDDWRNARWISMEQDGEIIFPFIDEPVAANQRKEGTIAQYTMPQFRKSVKLKERKSGKPLPSSRDSDISSSSSTATKWETTSSTPDGPVMTRRPNMSHLMSPTIFSREKTFSALCSETVSTMSPTKDISKSPDPSVLRE